MKMLVRSKLLLGLVVMVIMSVIFITWLLLTDLETPPQLPTLYTGLQWNQPHITKLYGKGGDTSLTTQKSFQTEKNSTDFFTYYKAALKTHGWELQRVESCVIGEGERYIYWYSPHPQLQFIKQLILSGDILSSVSGYMFEFGFCSVPETTPKAYEATVRYSPTGNFR